MQIELNNDEASFMVGVIAIWMTVAKSSATEYEKALALSIVKKITDNDKKAIAEAKHD